MPDTLPPVYDGIRGTKIMRNGVELDSLTENDLIDWLERAGDACKYHVYFAGSGRKYEVDVIATPGTVPGKAYVECKPHKGDDYLTDPANRETVQEWLDKMTGTIWGTDPGATLILIPWESGWTMPRQFLLNRGQRWRLVDLVTGARVPW